MTDKKFTDEEIIKVALEEEIHLAEYVGSDYCSNTEVSLLKSTLDLINRQKAEIERLKGSTIVNIIMESQKIKREAKDEAYKEFAEELKNILRNIPKWNVKKLNFNNVGFSYDDVFFSIDNLLKEKIKGDLKPQK